MCLRFLFTPPPPCPVLLFFHLFISVPFLHCPHRPWSIIFSPVLQMLYEACKRSPADHLTRSPHPTCFKSAGQHIRRKHLAIFMLPRSLGGAVPCVALEADAAQPGGSGSLLVASCSTPYAPGQLRNLKPHHVHGPASRAISAMVFAEAGGKLDFC